MTKGSFEAPDVKRKALFGIDGGWYEDYWYRDLRDTKPGILARLIRSIGKVITAAWIRRSTTLRQDTPTNRAHAPEARMVAGR